MSAWIIPDDGIIDPLAVQIAASGQRRVRLTRAERRLAAALILARGGSIYRVAQRLGIGWSTANALVASVTADPPEIGQVA